MKKLKSFRLFESTNSKIDDLKEYFFNIEDTYSDDIDINYNENSSDFLSISINFKTELTETIELKAKRYRDISDILLLVNRNLKKIEEEFVMDDLMVVRNYSIQFKLYYKSAFDDIKIEDIFIEQEEDFTMYINKYKLEKLVNDKYGIDIDNIDIKHDEDKDGNPYSQVSLYLNDVNFGVSNYIKATNKLTTAGQDDETKSLIKQIVDDFKVIGPLTEIGFRTRIINLYIEMPIDF
jgi:hypothetical protein